MVEGKDALLGQVSMRFGGEGTIAYPGQFALLVWDADTGWPNVVICQYLGDGTGAWHGLTVELRPPSTTNRDGTSRRGGSAFVGTWVSAALQRRIDDAKAVLVSASVK